jgi:prevent-host-death family protein
MVRTSATELKQHLGKYLDAALAGPVVIERQGRPTAVLVSVKQYEELDPTAARVLDSLASEFDELVARMQRRDFAEAIQRAFDASAQELGAAHRRGMRRRGR